MLKLAKALIDPQELFTIVADLDVRIESVSFSARLAPIPKSIAGKLIIRIHLKEKITSPAPLLTQILSDSAVQILVLFRPCEKSVPVLFENQVVVVVVEPLYGFLLGFLIDKGGRLMLLVIFFKKIKG